MSPSRPRHAEGEGRAGADIDPGALAVMASVEADMSPTGGSEFEANLARAQAGIVQRDEQLARDRAERERAAIDEPVSYAEAQPELEAVATADRAEADDIDLEI
jgi:hypothetical protein